MKIFLAPAKINLFLRIVRRRDDGYHDIETLFQRIGYCDLLRFERTGAESFALECKGETIGDGEAGATDLEKNLVTRAYRSLAKHAGRPIGGVRAILEKRIPVGGGLGGGSSDAATTLTALNELLELRVSAEDLLALAASLGSDVPFFLGPPAAIGRGRGEILTAVPHETCFWAALAFPRISVSTAQVYARYDPSDEAPAEDHLPTLVEALRLKNLSRTLALLTNAMEPLAFALEPRLGILRDELEAVAGQPVRMSGSGSTLFTLASSETKATRIAERWQATGSLRVATAPFLR